jgi:hypothetical protein
MVCNLSSVFGSGPLWPHRFVPTTARCRSIGCYRQLLDAERGLFDDTRLDIPVVAKTVGDLRSLSTWPPGLILHFPRPGDRHPESVVEVEWVS